MAGGPSDSQAVVAAKPGGAAAQGGPFHRRPGDKRLVKQVLSPQRAPTHWVPMDVSSTECKLMEVRKYSAEYHEIDSKFRKPHLELITAYAVQNPFLFGCYDLRREQIKMQLTSYSKTRPEASLKEKFFFYPTTFNNLEMILRNNFSAVSNIDDDDQADQCKHHVKFYTSSVLANEAFKGMGNPRVMLVARVAIVLCHHLHEETRGASSRPQPCAFSSSTIIHQRNSPEMVADTLANVDKTLFYKFNVNEMYPDHVLIYRDLDGPNDERSSRLVNDLHHCYISYRAGTRYNPDEREFKGRQHRADEAAAAAAAAVLTSTSPVGYHNAQTSIQIESEPPKKLSKANLQEEDDNSADKAAKANDDSADGDQGKGKDKKKKFSLISILNFKSSNEENENEAKRKHKKSFKGNPPRSLREEQEMEESMPLKSLSDKTNLNVVTSSNDEDRIEEASKETGAIPKRQSSKKIK